MSRHFITIKDIARELRISISTVSRAMRDTYDVNPETRQKVLEMAAQLKYKPNFNATGLARGSTHNIGILLPSITNYYFSTAITGIQEAAFEKGYNIILYLTNDSPDREMDILSSLSLSSLDGLLVSTSSAAEMSAHFTKVMDEGLPIVFFDRVSTNIRTSKVMQDDYNGAFMITEHLIHQGYSQIAHISGPAGLAMSSQRLNGYLAALEKHDIAVNRDWIIHSGFTQADGEQDTVKLLKKRKRLDAIFAVNDRKAIGAMQTLKQKGIAIGTEIGVAGFTGDPVSTLITPSLTTIAEPAAAIGRTSCELLLKHISKKNFIPEEIILPGKLLIRDSTRRS